MTSGVVRARITKVFIGVPQEFLHRHPWFQKKFHIAQEILQKNNEVIVNFAAPNHSFSLETLSFQVSYAVFFAEISSFVVHVVRTKNWQIAISDWIANKVGSNLSDKSPVEND